MKIIIAGSRSIRELKHVLIAMVYFHENEMFIFGEEGITLMHGGCLSGPDSHVTWIAKTMGWGVEVINADWEKHGRAAGPIRNQQMVNEADALIAIWDGESKGTAGIIGMARKKGIPKYVMTVKP